MSIVIDIAGYAIRLRRSDGVARPETRTLLGHCGVPPRVPRESFIWNTPNAVRLSTPRIAVPLADTWCALSKAESESFEWLYDSGDPGYLSLVDMPGEAIAQIVPEVKKHKTIVAIDNQLSEIGQEWLLNSLGTAGVGDVELLWRPVALLLAYLSSASPGAHESGDLIVVVDAESTRPEITCLELREHRGRLLPMRRAPREPQPKEFSWGTYQCFRRIAERVAGNSPDLMRELLGGTFAAEFAAFAMGAHAGDIWCRLGSEHVRVALGDPDIQRRRRDVLDKITTEAVRMDVVRCHDLSQATAVLWHGWPLNEVKGLGKTGLDVMLPSDAVAMGAEIYAQRLLSGEPTYLDTLPGLYILSAVKELGTFAYFPLVEAGVQEGGQIWRLRTPLTRFSVAQGASKFSAFLRRSDEPQCRKVITEIPAPDEDTPVIIRAEMKPASGRAKVTIEGAEGHEDVFGSKRAVILNWKNMTEVDDPVVYAPEVYPVRGRLFDDDDPEYMDILLEFLADEHATPYSEYQYRGHDVPFWKLMEPWGYSPPWYSGWGAPPGWSNEPTRGMFGSAYIEIERDLVDRLAQRINKVKTQDRVKFLNYMFIYAPESHKEEMRRKFSASNPSLNELNNGGALVPSFNWVIGPGRVFSTREDFIIFMDFMHRHASSGYPDYPNSSFTQHYWWSLFRCLCYHPDTANVPSEMIIKTLRMLLFYAQITHMNGKVAKYCLCAILFSLRLRSSVPDFLQPGDELCNELAEAIQDHHIFPSVTYPPAMLADVEDPDGDGLNGFVLRFLLQTASTRDLKALEGLTTSMA